MVVEMDDVLRSPAEVGDDEPDSREELATMPFNFCDYPALMIPHCGLVVELVGTGLLVPSADARLASS